MKKVKSTVALKGRKTFSVEFLLNKMKKFIVGY